MEIMTKAEKEAKLFERFGMTDADVRNAYLHPVEVVGGVTVLRKVEFEEILGRETSKHDRERMWKSLGGAEKAEMFKNTVFGGKMTVGPVTMHGRGSAWNTKSAAVSGEATVSGISALPLGLVDFEDEDDEYREHDEAHERYLDGNREWVGSMNDKTAVVPAVARSGVKASNVRVPVLTVLQGGLR